MTSTFVVQIASVPGNQVGHRRFDQSRRLHELLVSTLIQSNDKNRIQVLDKIVPEHKIILRSGFSQTAQWGLEPNMFIEVQGDENQARLISALFGEAFCQDGIGIGGRDVDGESHSVLIINHRWTDENERINFVSNILENYPSISAQMDVNGQLAFHDYSKTSAKYFNEIRMSIAQMNETFSIEEKQMKSELVDRTKYEDFLSLLESTSIRRALNILKYEHARLFSGYACASLNLPYVSLKRKKQQRRAYKQDQLDKINRRTLSPPHLCSLIITSNRPCMCLTDNNCFCHYTLVLTTTLP